jgi:ubiquinone/menaquinone biosynthesis C-methylase UbiE
VTHNVELHDLHQRYQVQAAWTRELRRRLLSRIEAAETHKLLEVGCGTGVILADLQHVYNGSTIGLDIDTSALHFSKTFNPQSEYVGGDGILAPFVDESFDITICHFLLMWVPQPLRMLQEMRRVTRSGGWVMALAEPDYEARIDHPPELVALGFKQREALRAQGVDPMTGRQLASYFQSAGLVDTTIGILGSEWQYPPPEEDLKSEWETLQGDLEGRLSDTDFQSLHQTDRDAWLRGVRVLFVPTFYAWARVP